MLVLTRNKDAAVNIGDDIAVTVRRFAPCQVTIQIDYPPGLTLKTAAGVVDGEPVNAGAGNGIPPSGPARLRASVGMAVEDTVWIGDSVSVKVLGLLTTSGFPCRARLGFTAPRELRIMRSELERHKGPGSLNGGS
jgi:sRNA-binding carbon storage regulator CsrA